MARATELKTGDPVGDRWVMDATDKVHDWKEHSYRANLDGETNICNGGWGMVGTHSLAKNVSRLVTACSRGLPLPSFQFGALLGKGIAYLREQRGISLIEVLIAVSILGVIAVPLLDAIYSSNRAIGIVDSKITAMNLAITHLETIRETEFKDSYSDDTASIVMPPHYEKNISLEYSSDGETWSETYTGQTLQRIIISISQQGKPIYSLCSYKYQ